MMWCSGVTSTTTKVLMGLEGRIRRVDVHNEPSVVVADTRVHVQQAETFQPLAPEAKK